MEGLTEFLGNISNVVNACGTWIGGVVKIVASEPVLLIPFGIAIAGSAIGLFHSLRS